MEIANGKNTPQACRDAQITTQTFYRWMGTRELDRRVPVAAREQVLQMYAPRIEKLPRGEPREGRLRQ